MELNNVKKILGMSTEWTDEAVKEMNAFEITALIHYKTNFTIEELDLDEQLELGTSFFMYDEHGNYYFYNPRRECVEKINQ